MNPLQTVLLLCFSLCCYAKPLAASDTHPVTILDGPAYYRELLDAIRNSKTTIQAALYTVSLVAKPEKGDKTQTLLDELALAVKRGVQARIIIDYKGIASWKFGERSFNAFYYLKERGVPVFFDDANIALHSKVVVIDSDLSFVGSSNWSNYAFEKNSELNVLVKDRKISGQILDYLTGIALDPKPLNAKHTLPKSFLLKDRGPLLRLYTGQSALAFDLLTTLTCFRDEALTYERVREIMKLQGSKNGVRRALNRELKKLEKAGLIRLETGFNKPFKHEFIIPIEEPLLAIPPEYFENGWNTRLSLSAKLFLLIFLNEARGKNHYYAWLESLATYYGVSNEIHKGRDELRRLGIITVVYSEFKEGVHTARSLIQFNGLYLPSRREAEIAALNASHGTENLKTARAFATVIYESFNATHIAQILELMKQYPPEALNYAFKTVENYAADNPRKSMKYVIGILQNPEKNWEK